MLSIKLVSGQEQHICDALQRSLLKMARRVAELEGTPRRELKDKAEELAAEVYSQELRRRASKN